MDNSTTAISAHSDDQRHTLPIAQGSGNLSAPPSITVMTDERQEFYISTSFLEFRGKVLTPGSSVNTTLPSLLRSPFILADRDVKKWFNKIIIHQNYKFYQVYELSTLRTVSLVLFWRILGLCFEERRLLHGQCEFQRIRFKSVTRRWQPNQLSQYCEYWNL